MRGLCRAKQLLKALSAKDGVLEEGVMWEQIPLLKVSLSSGEKKKMPKCSGVLSCNIMFFQNYKMLSTLLQFGGNAVFIYATD